MNCCRRTLDNQFLSCLYHKYSKTDCYSLRGLRAQSTGVKPNREVKPRLRAVDLAQKVQNEKQKSQAGPSQTPVSALQRRVTELRGLTQQLQNVHPNVLAKHLHRGILYQDKNVVIINKPYGLTVRGDFTTNSISAVLPVLSKMMNGKKVNSESVLLPCLGLEKEVTGALLLARSEKAAEYIANIHKLNQVQRKYWAITVGIPVPSEGIIDIPLIEREVKGDQRHFKMSLSPIFRMNESRDGVTKTRAHRQALPAVTKYKVLDSKSGCSLVELHPMTDVKHQLRAHMAFALNCPILGDHKYSHWSRLAPQKLPEQVLKKLKLEQSKIRNLPLHLHSRQLTIQQTPKAEINLTCLLPKYFFQSLGFLHLTFTDETDR